MYVLAVHRLLSEILLVTSSNMSIGKHASVHEEKLKAVHVDLSVLIISRNSILHRANSIPHKFYCNSKHWGGTIAVSYVATQAVKGQHNIGTKLQLRLSIHDNYSSCCASYTKVLVIRTDT